jgi:hypothetical protein
VSNLTFGGGEQARLDGYESAEPEHRSGGDDATVPHGRQPEEEQASLSEFQGERR